jgi:hypothetical protein
MANTTWSTTDKTAGCVLSGGNLVATISATNQGCRTLDRVYTGKYYFEITMTTVANLSVGITWGGSSIASLGLGTAAGQAAMVVGSGGISAPTAAGSVGGTVTNGWVLCIAVDVDNKLVWFRNGAAGLWDGNAAHNPATGAGGNNIAACFPAGGPFGVYAFAQSGGGGSVATANFGATAFTGAVPAGFTSGFPDSTTLINAEVLTQAAVEEWAAPIPPPMNLTQIAIEQWGSNNVTNPQMILTQAAIEQWASVVQTSRAGPRQSLIM